MSQHALEARVRATERRIDDVEDTNSAQDDSIYKLRRDVTALTLNMGKLLDHYGIEPATARDVDEALDSES